jgi:RNA polymerase sigma-70 factor (ECF subfamily)
MVESVEAGELSFATREVPDVAERTLQAARAGDVEAFEDIVRHYDERLRRLAHRLLGDAGAMDDALQEAYVKAFRGLPRFSGRSSLGTWLYRIVYNACLDQLRRSRHSAAETPLVTDRAAADDTEEIVLRRIALRSALAALPVEQRAAVLLVDAEGLSYAEAGKVLGCRTGTVASRLARGRETLRTALDDIEGTGVSR